MLTGVLASAIALAAITVVMGGPQKMLKEHRRTVSRMKRRRHES